MCQLNIIACANKMGVIGKNGNIPWHCSEDLKYFKEVTENHIVVMGAKTYESLGRKPLQNRLNIILSKSLKGNENIHNEIIFNEENELFTFLNCLPSYKKVFIIGGESIYKLFFHNVDKVYLNIVKNYIEGDKYFPLEKIKGNDNFILEEKTKERDFTKYVYTRK